MNDNSGKELALLGDTKRRILQSLLEGSKTATEIANKLQIQKSAVRGHLNSMQIQYLIKSYFKTERFGRPRRMYELTEKGHELFPRKYDIMLVPILKKLDEMDGQARLKRIIESITDDLSADLRDKIDKVRKNNSSKYLETSLKALNSISNDMGFVSSIIKEGDTYSILSQNCIVHKAALNYQDAICDGFHTRMIREALNGKLNVNVQLKECIALGNNHSRHIIKYNTDSKKQKELPKS